VIVVVSLFALLAAGVEPRRLALLAGAIYLPHVTAGLVLVHWLRSRGADDGRPALFCESVASELRAGANLREALAVSAAAVGPDNLSFVGDPGLSIAEMAARARDQFPEIGPEIELTVMAAARAGSDAASIFDEIGSLAIAQAEIRHEIRVATAPGRATALVLVGAPVVYLTTQLGSGGIEAYLGSSEQRLMALLGLGVFCFGLVVAVVILWRSGR
jgi:hypothetical protein